jgi:hypothetical protein
MRQLKRPVFVAGILGFLWVMMRLDQRSAPGRLSEGEPSGNLGGAAVGQCVANINNGEIIGRVTALTSDPQTGGPTYATEPLTSDGIDFPYVQPGITRVVGCDEALAMERETEALRGMCALNPGDGRFLGRVGAATVPGADGVRRLTLMLDAPLRRELGTASTEMRSTSVRLERCSRPVR